uniref:Peptidase S33 tripeptidyl aminopeptidase-like C-terminal domain-containing protein n=1 Tax=Bionectria ochroleuca TaxID=29856 RepID=A0A8H7N4F7_BIOOC
MDWRAEGSEKVAITVIQRPAKVQFTDERYGGAILVNPGGPSDSGIMHAVRIAEQLQTIVDSDDEGGLFFDVIGFDPGGVGYHPQAGMFCRLPVPKWDAPIGQSDDILEYFFRTCSDSSACAFREDSIEKTRARFHHLIESLDISPLPVSSTSEHSADVVTSSDLRRFIKEVVYHPVATFPLLDRLLVELADGNETTMAIRKQSGLLNRDRQLRRCDPELAFDLPCHDQSQWENEPAAAIICSDTRTFSNLTDEELLDFAESLQKRSWVMGWYWTELQLPCKGWTIRPSWHIDAPLGSNTSEPMLLIGNTVDPVTPLQRSVVLSLSSWDTILKW